MEWPEFCELVEDSADILKPNGSLCVDDNRVYGCNSKVWMAKTDNGVIAYSEAAFVNGILYLVLTGFPVMAHARFLSFQRQAGLKAVISRYEELTK